VPLDRLRKEAAYQRLLARLVEVAPPDIWALKGGLAMIARVGRDARATRDADTTWRGEGDLLAAALEAVVDLDLEDHFVFEIGEPRPITAESPDGGLRYSVVARLDGREFERLQLDVTRGPPGPSRSCSCEVFSTSPACQLPQCRCRRGAAPGREAPRLRP